MKSYWVVLLLFFSCLLGWGIFPTPQKLYIPEEPADQQSEMVSHTHGLFEGPRSGKWSTVRRKFIEEHPCCEACGGVQNLNVHHIFSFSDHPELELDPDNLITLCRTHHFLLGHSGKWATTNKKCQEEVKAYRRLHPWK
jgi:5-methylcytosine-specific restriction endonuclease McrA